VISSGPISGPEQISVELFKRPQLCRSRSMEQRLRPAQTMLTIRQVLTGVSCE